MSKFQDRRGKTPPKISIVKDFSGIDPPNGLLTAPELKDLKCPADVCFE